MTCLWPKLNAKGSRTIIHTCRDYAGGRRVGWDCVGELECCEHSGKDAEVLHVGV